MFTNPIIEDLPLDLELTTWCIWCVLFCTPLMYFHVLYICISCLSDLYYEKYNSYDWSTTCTRFHYVCVFITYANDVSEIRIKELNMYDMYPLCNFKKYTWNTLLLWYDVFAKVWFCNCVSDVFGQNTKITLWRIFAIFSTEYSSVKNYDTLTYKVFMNQ